MQFVAVPFTSALSPSRNDSEKEQEEAEETEVFKGPS